MAMERGVGLCRLLHDGILGSQDGPDDDLGVTGAWVAVAVQNRVWGHLGQEQPQMVVGLDLAPEVAAEELEGLVSAVLLDL